MRCRVETTTVGAMPSKLFVNLPIDNLARSVEFFTKLGFTFNPAFTDEHTTCMNVNDDAFFMLLEHSRFRDFTSRSTLDTGSDRGIYALSMDSRDEVHTFVNTALANGATVAKDDTDLGFMFNRAFYDLDGHHWEVFWMDPAAIPA
jgi:uncharacterized protein